MTATLKTGLIDHLRRSALRQEGGLSDGQLLDCFLLEGEEAALEALVHRHGAMVLGVCRRILGDPSDADDAFQAVFLVLVRKASTIQPRDMVGNWLYGVACRTALKAKAMTAKRRAREKQVRQMPEPQFVEPGWDDVKPLLDNELARLPAKYRAPLLLCDLEGRSQRDAARHLGWPEGTLTTRLARARRTLAARLTRRGIALSVPALAACLAQNAATAAPAVPLVASTVQAAGLVASGQGALVSAHVAALAERVLHGMVLAKVQGVLAVLFLLVTIAGGALMAARTPEIPQQQPEALARANPEPNRPPDESPTNPDDDTALFAQDPIRARDEKPAATLSGKIVALAADGKSFTLETPSANRRDEAKRTTVTLDDKAKLTFSAVGPGGAKLTEGMQAQVWMDKNVAVKAALHGSDDPRRPDFQGRVTSVARDRTSLTLESRSRAGEPSSLTVKLTPRTTLLFSGIGPDGAKLAEGLDAAVFLAHGSRDEAARILFQGREVLDRDTPRPNHTGKVLGAFVDFKGVMLQPADRQGLPNLGVKFDDKTKIIYQNVGPGRDRPMTGYTAQVWIGDNDGSLARMIVFQDAPRESDRILHGQVIAVANDGKSFTLERPPQPRSEVIGRPDIKITDRTRVIYQNVAPDSARLITGYAAQVWLEEGSEFTASQVILGPLPEERGRPER